MADAGSTQWDLIEGASAGREGAREAFARRYEPVVRAYLGARWRGSALAAELDDAVQEVFLDCFKEAGALSRVDPARPGGFRAYFFGVVRNVALRTERGDARRRVRPADSSLGADRRAVEQDPLSVVFDRAWAEALVREARVVQARRAAEAGEASQRRVELLRLRIGEGLPIRAIAASWNEDPARLHREYGRARREFHEALLAVVGELNPRSTPAQVERDCRRLLETLL